MNQRHDRGGLPAGIAIELDSLSLIALTTAHQHLQLFPKSTWSLLTLAPERLIAPVHRTWLEGLPWIRHTELFTAAYFGVLLLDASAKAWRARVNRVGRLIAAGRLKSDGMPPVRNLRRSKDQKILERDAAAEYGLPNAEAIDVIFAKLEKMAGDLEMTFQELCSTQAYIDYAVRNSWSNWECPTEQELKVLATGPAYLVDIVGRSRAKGIEDVFFAACEEWLLVVNAAEPGKVKCSAIYPPELLICGFENQPFQGRPRTPPSHVISELTALSERHFPGRPWEVGWMCMDTNLETVIGGPGGTA